MPKYIIEKLNERRKNKRLGEKEKEENGMLMYLVVLFPISIFTTNKKYN